MLVLTYQDLRSVLDGHEVSILDAVRRAYVPQGATAVPHSAFLAPARPRDGAIALPAFLSGAGAPEPAPGSGQLIGAVPA